MFPPLSTSLVFATPSCANNHVCCHQAPYRTSPTTSRRPRQKVQNSSWIGVSKGLGPATLPVRSQGHVVNADESSFEVTDGTGPPITVCSRSSANQRLQGQYVLVVGKLGFKRASKKDEAALRGLQEEESQRAGSTCSLASAATTASLSGPSGPAKRRKEWQLSCQKVRPLCGDPQRRAELWQREVAFLHEAVYPRLGAAGGGGVM
ncbi:hypothetical protein Agub_g11229 [Astrephomene gubernaculifera]|uniref:Uncharacterized protein n=1 Tax=Astrephomene gubernaculifera TaxID=47775 RepID=A0AAD3DW78_9CHLO|nr:hypothetical protein Agub_g11229 [Astrephomene gubernaculifera]